MPLGRKGEQFHPSRDVTPYGQEPIYGPTEFENIRGGVHIQGGGFYQADEMDVMAKATADWKESGADNPLTRPAQGRLFNPHELAEDNRRLLGPQRLIATDSFAEDLRDKGLRDSTIPSSHLQPRSTPRGTALPGTEITTQNQGRDWAGSGASGWYQGPANTFKNDIIAVDPKGQHPTDTLIHEMGHRRHIGEFKDPMDPLMSHPSGMNPDPLKEGAADAYEDRYAGPKAGQVSAMRSSIELGNPKFESYQFTGYSTNAQLAEQRGWDNPDRALYAAVRAHGSETGEQALYVPTAPHPAEGGGHGVGTTRPTMDATLHHLVTTSPHAAQALKDTGLEVAGQNAVRRHMDRQLLHQGQEIQGSLFSELRTESGEIHGYTPSHEVAPHGSQSTYIADRERADQSAGEPTFVHTMNRNQFNEQPRTVSNVASSLGVRNAEARKRGFTEI